MRFKTTVHILHTTLTMHHKHSIHGIFCLKIIVGWEKEIGFFLGEKKDGEKAANIAEASELPQKQASPVPNEELHK